jgi:hypothetical protein
MTGSRRFGCIGLGCVRWLLPWMSVWLVSVSLASVTNAAVTGSWHGIDQQSEVSLAPVVDAGSPSAEVGNVDEAQAVDRACYSVSLSDAVRHCSTLVISQPARMRPIELGSGRPH